MSTDPLDVLMAVDDLLHHPAAPSDIEKALVVLKKHAKQKLLLSYFAKALVLGGKYQAALEKADEAVADQKSSAWPRFWRAAALVGLGADAKQWVPELKLAYKGDRDVAKEAMAQPVFDTVRGSAEFLSAIGQKKGAAGPSVEVARLIKLATHGEPFDLWAAASTLGKHQDQPSIIDAKLNALEAICEDLDEHGEANLAEYGNKSPVFFHKALKAEKTARKALGKARSAFTVGLEVAE